MSATLVPADLPNRPVQGRRWYRRPAWWLVGAVLAVAAVAVVTDLPTRATLAGRQADLRSYLATVRGDVGQCSGGLADAVTADADAGAGRLRGSVADVYTTQAIAACSFTNEGIVDLGGLEAPRSLAALHLDGVAPAADEWSYLYAFTALQDLRQVEDDPSAGAPRAAFDREAAQLDRLRSRIDAQVAGAERRLEMAPAPLGLAVVTAPPATPVRS